MKRLIPFILFLLITGASEAQQKGSFTNYGLDDSIKAVQFMAEINVQAFNEKKLLNTGIGTDMVSISLVNDKKGKKSIRFYRMSNNSTVLVKGLNVFVDRKENIEFRYDWQINKPYKLLIAVATDSAANFSVYSGYAWLPELNKWKLIGTFKVDGRWNTIQKPGSFFWQSLKNTGNATIGSVWIQRSNGSWKNIATWRDMKNEKMSIPTSPTINLFGHIDSVQQRQIDIKIIEDAMVSGKTDVKQNVEAVYYTMMKEGTGRLVSVNDTVTAFYKGYLFVNDSVFDQTRDKPATFPLRRLIRGWQIGVPLCRVGGKIKLVIPSDLAYSIRTRSAKIPPNSILVFEIEVVDVKSGN